MGSSRYQIPPVQSPHVTAPTTFEQRLTAIGGVVLCSDIPTRLRSVFCSTLWASAPARRRQLEPRYVATLSLLDSVLLIGMMWTFMRLRGDRPRDVFIGPSPIASAKPRRPAADLCRVPHRAAVIMLSVRALLPWTHNVETNPLQGLLGRPADIAVFAVVAVVAGGVREELQRAFLMNRFNDGSAARSSASSSPVPHSAWGASCKAGTQRSPPLCSGRSGRRFMSRRRSAIAPVVSHSGFNLLQLVQLVIVRSTAA